MAVVVTLLDPVAGDRRVEGEDGASLMEAATQAGVPGIVAECGGAMSCASCHVFVDDAWTTRVGPPGETEDELLDDAASPREPTSRLSCQVVLTPELDGLVARVAPEQL